MKLLAVIWVLLLGGCAGLMQGPQMNADQLNAVAKDSNANAVHVKFTGTGGQGEYRSVNTDKGALGTNGGSATLKADGEIVIIVNPRPSAPPKTEPVAP